MPAAFVFTDLILIDHPIQSARLPRPILKHLRRNVRERQRGIDAHRLLSFASRILSSTLYESGTPSASIHCTPRLQLFVIEMQLRERLACVRERPKPTCGISPLSLRERGRVREGRTLSRNLVPVRDDAIPSPPAPLRRRGEKYGRRKRNARQLAFQIVGNFVR